jgi:hypothetical protein
VGLDFQEDPIPNVGIGIHAQVVEAGFYVMKDGVAMRVYVGENSFGAQNRADYGSNSCSGASVAYDCHLKIGANRLGGFADCAGGKAGAQ